MVTLLFLHYEMPTVVVLFYGNFLVMSEEGILQMYSGTIFENVPILKFRNNHCGGMLASGERDNLFHFVG